MNILPWITSALQTEQNRRQRAEYDVSTTSRNRLDVTSDRSPPLSPWPDITLMAMSMAMSRNSPPSVLDAQTCPGG